MANNLIPYSEGMDYGVGLDSPSGGTRNNGVQGAPTSIPNAGGMIVEYGLTEVSSDEDLQTSLGVSASASGGVGLFSASASMNFAQSCHVHSSSVFLVASVKVTLAFSQIVEPKIQPEAAQSLADGNPTRFQEMYGDSFIQGLETGGRFFAVVEIFTSSSDEQQSLSISLKGSYGAFSASGSFSTSFHDAVQSRSLKITVHQEGGVVPKEPTSLEDVQAVASGFAASVQDHAVPYAATIAKYTILDLPNPPNYIDLQNQMDVLKFCAEQRNTLWTALNNVDYIIANPTQFKAASGDPFLPALATYRTALEVDLAAVTAAASHALDDPKGSTLPTLSAVAPSMPDRVAVDADALAAIGQEATGTDPLAAVLLANEADADSRRGFLVGMGVMDKHTLWGPGAQTIKNGLGVVAQLGFATAAAYCLQRNNNVDNAGRGLLVVKADPKAQSARSTLPVGLSWLGFDVAAGLFGGEAAGGLGHTAMGPGAAGIRATLDGDGQRGFDVAVTLFLSGG